jgi:poly(3-hydroxybutyrate) depolymerase
MNVDVMKVKAARSESSVQLLPSKRNLLASKIRNLCLPGVMLALLLGTASSLSALTKTTTTIKSSINPSSYGQSVKFTATVTSTAGAPPNGETISFEQGSKVLGTASLSGGSANFSISTLTPGGTDNIKAVYPGDSNFASSTSTAVAQVVNKASTTTTLASSQNPSNVGQSVTLTATVSGQYGGTVTGNVQFMNGSTKLGTASLSGGVATYSTSKLAVGSDSLTAVFNGSADWLTSTSSALSQTVGAGSYIDSNMTWDGVTRYYEVFVPTALPAHPALLFMLHGTRYTSTFTPEAVISLNWGWDTIANEYGFILVKPASTYDPSTTQWNWNAYFMNASFPASAIGTCTSPPATGCPDDAGFLRQLITTLSAQYNVNQNQVYVTGFSSGAQMAERVGVEISDLVAAIAPVSGQLVGQYPPPPTLPGNAHAPISVQEWHGTKDQNLWPCGYGTTSYSGVIYTLDTVDDTFNYWVNQNSCKTLQTTATLCSGSTPNNANDAPTPGIQGDTGNMATGCSQSGVEVQFIWEPGVAHSAQQQTNPQRWQFFTAHAKQ